MHWSKHSQGWRFDDGSTLLPSPPGESGKNPVTMKYRILMALLAVGLCSDGLAQANGEFPRIGLVGAGAGKTPVSRDQFIILVVEGPYLSYEKNQIPDGGWSNT